jgi:hypothetical protein
LLGLLTIQPVSDPDSVLWGTFYLGNSRGQFARDEPVVGGLRNQFPYGREGWLIVEAERPDLSSSTLYVCTTALETGPRNSARYQDKNASNPPLYARLECRDATLSRTRAFSPSHAPALYLIKFAHSASPLMLWTPVCPVLLVSGCAFAGSRDISINKNESETQGTVMGRPNWARLAHGSLSPRG